MRKDITKKFLKKINGSNSIRGWWYKNHLFDLKKGMNSKDKELPKIKKEIDLLLGEQIEFTNPTRIEKKTILQKRDLKIVEKEKKERIDLRRTPKMMDMEMIYCDQDYFQMGDTNGLALNAKRLAIIDKPFWLSNIKITKGWYESVMGYVKYKGDYDQKCLIFEKSDIAKWNQPMDGLTWYDTILFCNKLSEMLNLEPYYSMTNIVYFSLYVSKSYYNDKPFYLTTPTIAYADVEEHKNANGFRLPYEKEWEYAAKAGTNYEYFGTSDYDKIKEYAWFGKNSNNKMRDVATKKPNAWGFYDMFGLVYEWCYDPFDFSTSGLLDNVNDVYEPRTKKHYKKELVSSKRIMNLNRHGEIFDANGQLSQNYKELFENFRVCRGCDHRIDNPVFMMITHREILPINPYNVEEIKENKKTTCDMSESRNYVGFRIARNVDDF
jgi:formylglycine-generating enzyme required for sulfatase activity